MTIESQRTDLGGLRGYGIVKEVIELIEDVPTEEFTVPYTIIMPRPLTEVRMSRQFHKGRCVVYDPEVAREFLTTLHYAVEPELPTPAPRKKKLTGRRYVRT